ncbi:hypothetical protein HQQ80_09170 [Microbacteriaceae bacterium VKM Ac-2855]|nr:hypothetical protein [Microbacteriaceae bacterium VKM Ac-2855]
MTIAYALGLLEDATNGDTWRSGGEAHRAYLEQLSLWGYQLSRVEKILLGQDDRAVYEKK